MVLYFQAATPAMGTQGSFNLTAQCVAVTNPGVNAELLVLSVGGTSAKVVGMALMLHRNVRQGSRAPRPLRLTCQN